MTRVPLAQLPCVLPPLLGGLFSVITLAPAAANAAPDAEIVVELGESDPDPDPYLATGPVTDWVFLVVNDINDNLGASDSELPSLWLRWAAKLAVSLDEKMLLVDDLEVRIDKLDEAEGTLAAVEVALFLGLPAEVLREASEQIGALIDCGAIKPEMQRMTELLEKAAFAVDHECML